MDYCPRPDPVTDPSCRRRAALESDFTMFMVDVSGFTSVVALTGS